MIPRDPYRYFRIEARELLDQLSSGALELERGPARAELVPQMLRLAHTLKGASRVVGQTRIAELAHAVEDVLAPRGEEGHTALGPSVADSLLKLLDEIGSCLAALDAPVAPQPETASPPAAESLAQLRVAAEDMDALLQGVLEIDVRLQAIRGDLEEIGRARGLSNLILGMLPSGTRANALVEELGSVLKGLERRLGSDLDHADHEVGQARDRAHDLRLVPASGLFSPLERAARDAAQSLGRSIRFETSGGEHRLEANVLSALRGALIHVVRNAVAHGIEPAAERRTHGKPAEGSVRLDVQRRGNRVAFVCSDDGRGIDIEKVRRAAVSRGALADSAAAALSPAQLLELILKAGVSTTETVTQVSGRGIGLDVLRTTAAQLSGEVHLTSEMGKGTTVEVSVPVSLTSFVALLVRSEGAVCSLPLDSVRQTRRLASSDIGRAADRDSVVIDGEIVPFMPLSRALRRAPGLARPNRPWSAVVIGSGSQLAAIGVDALVGTTTVVLRPLPALAGPTPVALGASFDAEGNPQLVLDPRGVVQAAYAGREGFDEVPALASRAPVLIIDDSLTTRMLEQSILESAGYEVDVATSAEEALAKAREVTYGLFLVDVEMPGMDGFEFVARTRTDPALLGIPSILVTSRNADEDRRRGEEVGARAYIVKGEFDQGQLLRAMRQLIG